MCVAKKPKIPKPSAEDEKDPAVIRNPILDGMLGNIAALRGGRNALRIDLLNPLAIPVGGGSGGAVGGGGSGAAGGGGGGSTGGGTSSGSGGSWGEPTVNSRTGAVRA
jgi:hypothetical protein